MMLRGKNTPEGRKWIKRKNNYNNEREGRQIKILRKILKFKIQVLHQMHLSFIDSKWSEIFSHVLHFTVNVVEIITLYEKKGISGRSFVLISQIQHSTRVRHYTLPNHQKVCHYAMSQKYLESKFNQGLSWCLKAVRHADGAKSFQTKDTSF